MADLSDVLLPDTILVTVNNRLAAELRARYDTEQRNRGLDVWVSADILPWNAWLQRQYQDLIDNGNTDRDLLSPSQERLLWQDVIEKQADSVALLRPAGAARGAQQSARLYADWQLERLPVEQLGGEQTQTFLSWLGAFRSELARRGQMTMSDLPPLIASALDEGVLRAPTRLVHSGFDTLSPAQHTLIASLVGRGCDVVEHVEQGPRGDCRRTVAIDKEAEIRLAAAWADEQTRRDSHCQIAVIVPQLAALKATIERVFDEHLATEFYLLQQPRQTRFNLSLGEPLADSPLVAHALLLLELTVGAQPLNSLGQVLRSPFVGGHSREWEQRALVDAALRDNGMPRVGLRALRNHLDRFAAGDHRHCPDLFARSDAVLTQHAQLPSSDTPAAWAGHLQGLLALFGWPGDTPLDSPEHQQYERMKALFCELATLGKIRASLRLGEAVQWLRSLATETIFQAESPATRIQVLGPLEAAGMQFDAIWLLGMHDQIWPPPPGPDPLIPTRLQRELGMPHASAERELEFASALTARLARGAAQVIASHARLDGEREQRPSPLTRDWPLVAADTLAVRADDPLWEPATPHRETLPVVAAPPPPAALRGGAGLLAAQAGCPFKAVAGFRLDAQALSEASFAPDGLMVGNLVHDLLERVWRALGDSTTLAQQTNEQLHALVELLAQATLADLGRRRPDLFTPRYARIEARRLATLVVDWLALEKQRQRPFHVTTLEQRQHIELHGMQLAIRADRIDQFDDGSVAVIDYKTGSKVSIEGWFDERLSEPQVPLYCVQTDRPVRGALLARVRSDNTGCRFIGLGSDTTVAPGVTLPDDINGLDWEQIRARWYEAIDLLASEIVAGRADPTPSPQVCQYCDFGALCRVSARSGTDANGGDD